MTEPFRGALLVGSGCGQGILRGFFLFFCGLILLTGQKSAPPMYLVPRDFSGEPGSWVMNDGTLFGESNGREGSYLRLRQVSCL